MKKFQAYDDIDAANGHEVKAEHHDVELGWNGTVVTIDLSEANFRQLDNQLGHLLKLGTVVRKGKKKSEAKPVGPSVGRPGRRPKAYYDGLVAWVDANRITKKNGSGKLAYESSDPERNEYPEWLIKMYDEHLAKQDAA